MDVSDNSTVSFRKSFRNWQRQRQYFLEAGQSVYLSDIRANYRKVLETLFASYPTLQGVLDIDIADPAFSSTYQSLLHSFDAAFALNVVEYVEGDLLALSNIKKLIKPGGTIVILVPAYQALYNQFDEELCHYRRYNARSLNNLFVHNELSLVKTFYFNFAGIFGWYVSGKLQRNKTIPGGQMNLYNKLVPLFKIADKFTFNKVGLSVICVGKVK